MTGTGANNNEGSIAALDRYIAPGLRLWMLIALVSGILLVMGLLLTHLFSLVIVCCFMRIRIPRTKRQIDLIAAKRKMRKSNLPSAHSQDEQRAQPIVMNTVKHSGHHHKSSSSSNRREFEEDTAESVPLVHKTSSHATTTV
ncbi:unnamed protein product [Gongylonema pulchrum]|uniref:Conserved plasma membrane protein n=1 Tax=Gongylonema pulchrum TaxID=637853 RepID=A0A183ET76_9BILA|nr:unnamed protein product [Gongylonema pulchrum]